MRSAPILRITLLATLTAAVPAYPADKIPEGDEPVPLDPIEVVAERSEQSDSLLPTDRGAPGIYGTEDNPLEIPRSVTVVSPELLRLTGVTDFSDLSEVSAGAERSTFWGIAGSPELRGTHAGVYFDGMLRVWQRNEMPTSFGSCEALDVVRGPVPAQLEMAPVGGYVDMIPKSPWFGDPHATVTFEAGSWDKYYGQIDAGGSMTALGGMPAAWRISVSGQRAGSYYDNVRNDFASLYATMIVQTDRRTTLTFSTEYFDHRSSEISGWNRVTQQLVDSGEYVIGEPVDITDSAWNGTANRTLVTRSSSTGIQDFSALVVPASVVQEALKKGLVTQAQVNAMLNLSNADDRARAYGQALPSTGQRDSSYDASGNATLDAALAKAYASGKSTSGYRYTEKYFELGGTVFTTKIKGNQILSDDRDYAKSRDGLFNVEWKRSYDSGAILTDKFFAERLCTRKHSTYGFAVNSDQSVVDDRLSLSVPVDALATTFTTGVEGRYTKAIVTQDFYAEPFSRRDISLGYADDNSVVEAGDDIAPDGLNLWSPGRGANLWCQLAQADVFLMTDTKLSDRWRLYTGVRGEGAEWRTHLADGVDRSTETLESVSRNIGGTYYDNASISPVFEFAPGWRWYAAAQTGTALAPGDQGTVVGRANFSKANLLETGVKASLLKDRLYWSADVYRWQQSRYSEIDARALPMRGVGVETETTAKFGDFELTGEYTFQRVRLLTDDYGYALSALTEEEWALSAGSLTAGEDYRSERNPDNVYEGTPQHSARLLGVYNLPDGFGIGAGPHWRSSFYSSMDRVVRLPSSVVWDAVAFWRRGGWDVTLHVNNFTNEVYYYASDPVFSGNALVLRAEPIHFDLSVAYTF